MFHPPKCFSLYITEILCIKKSLLSTKSRKAFWNVIVNWWNTILQAKLEESTVAVKSIGHMPDVEV